MARERSAPGSRPDGARAKGERQERLAEALRANLRKRKAQKRGRDTAARAVESGPDAGEALEGADKVK